MNIKVLFKTLLISGLVLGLAACDDDDDGAEPDISNPTFEFDRPEHGEVRDIEEGDDNPHMHFRGTAESDPEVELSELQVDIHGAIDGHDHGKRGDDYHEFHYDEVLELDGNQAEIDHDIYFDHHDHLIEGEYHICVEVVDEDGRSLDIDGASEKCETFEIHNEYFGPGWDNVAIAGDDHLYHDDILELEWRILGNGIDVEEIWIDIIHEEEGEVHQWHDDHLHTEVYDDNADIVVEEDWPEGDYEVEFEVELENGYHYHWDEHLHFDVH